MKALVLEPDLRLAIRDIQLPETLGPKDLRIKIHSVGICGSDVHYYKHGSIGPFVVREPMVLGHEASGTVIELGAEVKNFKLGDRVCMEPGIPDAESEQSRTGYYNLDPAVRFWATPPIHGVLCPSVVHPASFTYKLPDNVSFAEGAMVEPLAVGMHAATKAVIRPGDVALVIGSGTIGMVTVLAALAGGCSKVILSDVQTEKLAIGKSLAPESVFTVNVASESLGDVVAAVTGGRGVDVVFECSGNGRAAASVFEHLAFAGRVVFVGMPAGPVSYDVVAAQLKEARVEHVFRYANVYAKALSLMGSGKIDLKPLITDSFGFEDSIEAFDFAAAMPPSSVKVQIVMGE